MYVCLYVCMYVSMYVCLSVCMYVCRLYYHMSVFPSKSRVKMEGSEWTNEVPAPRPSTPLLSPTPACPSAYVHPVGISGFTFHIFNKHADSFKSFQGSKQVPTSSNCSACLECSCVSLCLQYSLGGCDTLWKIVTLVPPSGPCWRSSWSLLKHPPFVGSLVSYVFSMATPRETERDIGNT